MENAFPEKNLKCRTITDYICKSLQNNDINCERPIPYYFSFREIQYFISITVELN